MIDMHTHIIFGVDDGSEDLEMSKNILNDELKYDVKTVVLTPHLNENSKVIDLIKERYEILKKEEIGINILLGSEIYYYKNMIDDLDNKRLLTFNNTKYILVEFSTRVETPIVDILNDLMVSGYKPIIAHIERYPYLKYDEIIELHNMGVLIQVNSKTFGEKIFKKMLKKMVKDNLIDLVASDCHNLDNRNVDFDVFLKKKKKYKYILDRMEWFENELLKR